MRPRKTVGAALLGLALVCAVACEKSGDSESSSAKPQASPANPAPAKSSGIESIAGVPPLFEKALALARSTWPGAKVGGVKIGEEVPPGARANEYALRVSFEFDADPHDPTAKSGSVVCSPECQVIRHKVKRAPAAPFPCPFDRALAVARRAGVKGKQPVVAYGYWNFDGRAGWTFRDDADAPVVEIGDGCKVSGAPDGSADSPDLSLVCETAERLGTATPENRARFREMTKSLKDPDIKRGFDAIGAAGPGQYYALARQIAKEAGYPGWECPALARFAETMK